MMYKYFFINYNQYIVFVPEGRENAITRRLYNDGNGGYYFTYNKKRVHVSDDQLYR